MDDYVSESDSDYTSYWRDWVSFLCVSAACLSALRLSLPSHPVRSPMQRSMGSNKPLLVHVQGHLEEDAMPL